ncbi:MAG: hypothetical protein U0745_01830 [Polyangia bacterium]
MSTLFFRWSVPSLYRSNRRPLRFRVSEKSKLEPFATRSKSDAHPS